MLDAGHVLDDRFEIRRLVASGGMGQVFHAYDRQTGEEVAVKLLVQPDERARKRFLGEAEVLSEIHHPGIVRYISHGLTPSGAPYLVMEWLQGEDLAAYLERLHPETLDSDNVLVASVREQYPGADARALGRAKGKRRRRETDRATPGIPGSRVVPIAAAIQLGRRLSSAVAELHQRGIVHRDIKPANVFLRGGLLDQAKLLDFGTALRSNVMERRTEPGMLIGTPHYMAPEQARTNDIVGPPVDVWAIGCVLYECLTGVRPFNGDSILVVLTRIVVDDPPPIRLLRGELPRELGQVITRALAKKPSERYSDARQLAWELDRAVAELGGLPALERAAKGGMRGYVRPASAITEIESRLTCMLFASSKSARAEGDSALAEVAGQSGGTLQRLADGTLLVTIAGNHTPSDQAARAARVALALRAARPELGMVLATGRIEVPSRAPFDQVVSAAAAALRYAQPGQIRLDEWTAPLIEARFHTQRDEYGALLLSERQDEAMRTLLGKASRWVGRSFELALLMNAFDECLVHESARVVLVTAQTGMGKSRLLYEFESELRRRGVAFGALSGRGDVVSAGSPFIMIAPAIRRLAQIRDGEPLSVQRAKLRARLAETCGPKDIDRLAAYIGEIIGVPFSEESSSALRAARQDPMVLGRLMQRAWEDWLRAECAEKPFLLLLDDLHWGDLPSVQFIDSALGALAEHRLLVVALARPDIHNIFPQLWAQRGVQVIQLASLPKKACMTLVQDALGEELFKRHAAQLVERAGGNVFYLEELIRAVAEAGPGIDISQSLPDTILGMVQSRLDALPPEARQVLRAASIFGEVFWQGGVEALVGERCGVFTVGEWLSELCAREVVSAEPEARIPNENQYKFRHVLIREGAYALLADEDRRLGHAMAGEWLVASGERDGLILAEHFVRGNDRKQAVPWFQQAAEQALEGNDLDAALSHAERGVTAGASGVVLGALRALQAMAAYWQGGYTNAQRYATSAMVDLPAGSSAWFMAAGSAIVSTARLGEHERAEALCATITRVEREVGAESAQIICLCRGAIQLVFHGQLAKADDMLVRVHALAQECATIDPLTAAEIHHVRGWRAAASGDKFRLLHYLGDAVEAFEKAGDARNAALERTTVAWCWAGLGYVERAAELGAQNLEVCREQNALHAITYAKVNMGYILGHLPGRRDHARVLLDEALAECRAGGNTRLEGWACGHMAWLAHQDRDYEGEEKLAVKAAELLRPSPGLRTWALASHARALLAQGKHRDALSQARAAMAILERLGSALQGEGLPPLMLATALFACGEKDAAREAIAGAIARLRRRLQRLPGPSWRAAFLGLALNRTTIELARDWGVPIDLD